MICFKHARRNLFKSSTLNSLSANKTRNDIQVIVIGAGLAGLSAAKHLFHHGFKSTIILEATDRTGGRVNSKHFGDVFCELGAKWISIDASQDSIYELIQQASGLQKKIQQKEDTVYVNTFGEHVHKKMPEFIDNLFKKICSNVEFQEKYKNGNLYDLNNVHTYFKAESEKIIGQHFKEVNDQIIANDIFVSLFKEFGSFLGCCLEYVNIEHITKLSKLNDSPIYLPTGMDNLISQITETIDKTNMKVGKPVGEIKWFDLNQPERKFVGCMDGSLFPADHIICTLPLGVLKNFSKHIFKPVLPLEKTEAIDNLGFGNPVKIYLEYKESITPWFVSNLRPLWSKNEDEIDILKWTKQIVEVSKIPTSSHVLEILVGGYFYEEIEKVPDSEVFDEVTKLLRKLLKNPSIPLPTSILRSNWSTSACYLGGRPYFSISSSEADVNILAAPLGRVPTLLFAGDATIWNGFGTVDGARRSGVREAQRIVDHYNKLL